MNNLCLCGCGEEVKIGNKFINYHNKKGKFNPNFTDGKTLTTFYCKICEKEITWNTFYNGTGCCYPCSLQFRKSLKGQKVTWGDKISKTKLERDYSGERSSNFKGGLPNCIDCGKLLSRRKYIRCIQCHLIKMKKNRQGRNSNLFGKTPKFFKITYKNNKLKSFWEYAFAQFLDLSDIKWEYESKTFDLGNTTYTPDFYLTDFGCYIEIKGWDSPPFRKKFRKFKRLYKNISLYIFKSKQLKQYGILI